MLPNELTAVDAAAAIRAGRLRSSELVEACLQRIADREPELRAWACIDPDFARAQAVACDAAPPRGALHGVPIGVKDIIDSAELPTAYGSAIYAGHRPAADAACVALARAAGAVLLGKTASTEFAYFQPGPTRNPQRPTHTPGGSSSGSAAAVADRMVPLAFGTQTAGSITRPASYCGVVGYKPSFGDFSLAGVRPFAASLDTLGVMARSVADAALLRGVLLGEPVAPLVAPPLGALRIGLARTPWWDAAEPATCTGIEALAVRLARAGAAVEEVALPASCDALVEIQKTVMAREAAAAFAHELRCHRRGLSAPLLALLDAGAQIAHADYRHALLSAQQARAALVALFERCDVLLAPAANGEAPAGLDATGDPLFSRAWTLLGTPTVALPAFTGPSGLPISVQLVGAIGADQRLLAAAAALQTAF